MADYITLLGAEDVARAARNMAEASAEMSSAARNINYSLTQHQRFLDDWLQRLEASIERLSGIQGPTTPPESQP